MIEFLVLSSVLVILGGAILLGYLLDKAWPR